MKIPTINWSQNNNFIFIDIQLLPTEYEIKINETNITFKQDDYECNIKLYKNIDSKKSKYKTNRIFEFIFKKKENEEWKQLLENKNQYNVSVNWNKCDISDDECNDDLKMPDMSEVMENQGMPDMSALMGNQGMPDMSALMGNEGMPDMSALMGNQGMPDMSALMGNQGMPDSCIKTDCKGNNCKGCK